ncbi:hypothetical protein GCM10027579_18810 [Calidifontibacter terrae]
MRLVGEREQVAPTSRATGDPWRAGQVGEPHRLAGGERVIDRQCQAHVVIEQLGGDEVVQPVVVAAEVEPLIGEGDSDVALPSAQRGQRLRRLALGEADLHLGKTLFDQRERPRNQGRGR